MFFTAPRISPNATAAQRFVWVLHSLCWVMGGGYTALEGPMGGLVYYRVIRLQRRFESLVARVQAGEKPRIRASRAGASRPAASPTSPPGDKIRLPTHFAWLVGMLPYSPRRGCGGAHFAQTMRYALVDPEIVALIASDPRFGRMVRPICWMLGISIPDRPFHWDPASHRARPRSTNPQTGKPHTAKPRTARPRRATPGRAGEDAADANAAPQGPAPLTPATPPPDRTALEAGATWHATGQKISPKLRRLLISAGKARLINFKTGS